MKPLRIGLLLDGTSVAHWQYIIIEQLQAANATDLVVAIINQAPPQAKRGWGHLWSLRSKAVWKIHEVVDQRLFPVAVNASARRDLTAILQQMSVVNVTPRKTKYCDFLEPVAIQEVQSYEIDVVIRFGFRIIQGEFLKIAKYGIWSFHHADNRINRGGPPGYWELFNGEKNTGITLQILNADLDGGFVIDRALCGNQGISIHRNRNNIFLRSAPMVLSKLQQLANLGWDNFIQQHHNSDVQIYSHTLYQTPDTIPAFTNVIKALKRGLSGMLRRLLYKNQWTIIIKEGSGSGWNLRKFKALTPPKHEYWADPFVVVRDKGIYVFFEAVPYTTYKGYIAVVVYENGKWSQFKTVLAPDYHLSFPFIFEFEGRLLMLPEAASKSELQFYECIGFPEKWEPVGTPIPHLSGIDSVVHFHEGKWYLFTTLQETPGAAYNEVLTLWYTDNLLEGPWQAHPQSPLCRDVTKGRMAGRIFALEGELYRPAQNGTAGYGGAVGLYKITHLSPAVYREEWVSDIAPNWDTKLTKLHTWNVYENLVVSDTMRLKPRFW